MYYEILHTYNVFIIMGLRELINYHIAYSLLNTFIFSAANTEVNTSSEPTLDGFAEIAAPAAVIADAPLATESSAAASESADAEDGHWSDKENRSPPPPDPVAGPSDR